MKAFDSSIVDITVSDSIVNLLPPYFRTTKNQMFLNTSINELFRKGGGAKINGYVGIKPNWFNSETDFYISELNQERNDYQLEPTMVCETDNTISNIVYYTDYLKNIKVNGGNIDNQNRLFEQEYVSWCPPIQLDMFVNYRCYYWKGDYPDYIVMEKGAIDGNAWSLNNNWYHIEDITDDISNYTKAERSIICFIKNIELFNYGTYRRDDVDFLNSTISDITQYKNINSFIIDGITIDENYLTSNNGVTILVTGEKNSSYNNKVYRFLWINDTIVYQVIADGFDSYGSPQYGDTVRILKGNNSGKDMYYNGIDWIISQSKTSINQAPLFNLYSYNYDASTDTQSYISLSDVNNYPSTNFKGNKILSYSIDEDGYYATDTVLNLSINRNSSGNLLFQNYLLTDTYSYIENLIEKDINGMYFYKVNNSSNGYYYSNNWYNKNSLSKQWIIDEFEYTGDSNVFTLSQDPENKNYIEVIVNTKSTDNVSTITSNNLVYDKDYIELDKTLVIYNLNVGDYIKVRTYNKNTPESGYNGYYELPISLSANCVYDNISTFAYGDVFEQFIQIIQYQSTFTGNIYGENNYRNIENIDLSLGDSIIETSSSLLLNMALVSNNKINVNSSIRYSANQYRSYKFKFINQISDMYKNGIKNDDSDIDTWVEDALTQITRGQTETFPFYNSRVGVTTEYSQDHFIPPTPAFLGLMLPTNPYITTDFSAPTNPEIIIGHDSSITLTFGDIRDSVLLAFEKRIYDSIPISFKSSNYTPFNIYNYINNGFNTDREYSITEWNNILEQNFLYWTSNHNIDYIKNTTYDSTNPFTWNWSSVTSTITNEKLLGGWRGIYNYYYGTDAPHSRPWEMLGFKNKPTYWDSKYGEAPYTSNNKIMWNDIETGTTDTGTYQSLARPNLSKFLPVDEQGYLLDPVQCGIATNYPNQLDAQDSWSFGDISPIENVWRRTSEYQFGIQIASYLAKPAMYLSYCWNTRDFRIINKGEISEQWINSNTLDRPKFSEYTIHGETVNNELVYNYGMQQYISNYIISQSLSISTEIGDILRNLTVKLGYRFAGFVDSNNITVSSDSYGEIPSENIHINLYESPTTENIFYSGVAIIKQASGWKIYGYDSINTYFNIYEVDNSSIGTTLSVDNYIKTQTPQWNSNIAYKKNEVVIYHNKKYICLQDHVSTTYFEISKWKQISQVSISNQNSVTWYYNIKNTIKKIPYGYMVSSYQELCDILNGLQNYYESVGIRFDQNTNGDWKDIIKSFMSWDLSDALIGEYITFSPLSGNVTINNDFGNIENIFDVSDNYYNLIDAQGKNIKENNIRIVRGQTYTSVIPTDSVLGGIFGCRFYKNTIEHILLIDNTTIFNDVIYSPKFNVAQSRLRLETLKTTEWTGKMIAPGFIVSGNTIMPNFDTAADNFRYYFDIEESFYNDLQERARLNIGYFEKNYFNEMLITSTNQFEYYIGMIQNKGTNTVFNRLTRSTYISNNRVFNFNEEWAFRLGCYGSDNIKNIDLKIYQSDFTNNPQLYVLDKTIFNTNIEYKNSTTVSNSLDINIFDNLYTNYDVNDYIGNITINNITLLLDDVYTGNMNLTLNSENLITNYGMQNGSLTIDVNKTLKNDNINLILTTDEEIKITIVISYTLLDINQNIIKSNYININDVVNENGKIIKYDDRWIYSNPNNDNTFKKSIFNLDNKTVFSNAGYVSTDTVKWYSTTFDNFTNLYYKSKVDYPSTIINKNYTFDLTGKPNIITTPFVKSNNVGYYRITSISYDITKTFSYPVTINIGTKAQLPVDPNTNNYSSSVIDRFSTESMVGTTSVVKYFSNIIYLSDDIDNGIYIQVDYSNVPSEIPENIILGSINVSITLEWVTNSILPEDRVWVYDIDDNDNWSTYKLYDTGYNIDNISYINKNTTVTLPAYYTTDNKISLSTLLPNSSYIILDGIQNNTTLSSVYKPVYSNTISTVIDGTTQTTSLITLNSTAGMNIDSMSINVIKPFTTSDGSELDIKIGTIENTSLVADSSVINNPYPAQVSFDPTQAVTVTLPNKNITYLTNSTSSTVYVTRYGNIFNIPNKCDNVPDTSFTWKLYTCDTNGTIDTTNILSTGNVTFGNPDDTSASKESYWLQSVNVELTSGTTYAFVISDVSGGILGPQSTTYITLSGKSESYVLFDPTLPGVQSISTDLINNTLIDGDLNFTLGNSTTGIAYVTINYSYTNGFEIVSTDNNSIELDSTLNSGNIFVWIPTRYKTISDFNNNVFKYAFKNGNYIEIDNNNNLWNICKYDGTSLLTYIEQEPQIISDYIENAILYNNDTKITEEVIEVYDPYKGKIPSQCKKYLDYMIGYDPASYNKSNNKQLNNLNVWSDNEIGKLWWDISTTKYLDYEIGDYNYKWKNWGKLCPEYSIDIYEWVKSPVLPSLWNNYVSSGQYSSGFCSNPSGTVEDLVNTNWSEKIFYDETKNIEITAYYFWVKLPTTIMSNKNKLSATQISNIIENPINGSIPYISIIDDNKFILSGVKQYIDSNTVLKIKWKNSYTNNNFHKEWLLVKENDSTTKIDSNLWNKMTDSLVGYKEYSTSNMLNFTLYKNMNLGNTTAILEGDSKDLINIPSSGQIKIGKYWFNYNGKNNNTIYNIENYSSMVFDKGTSVIIETDTTSYISVPDNTLTDFEKLGNLNNPMQSWFLPDYINGGYIASREARKQCIQILNNILSSDMYADLWYDINSILTSSDIAPTNYTFNVIDFDYRNALVVNLNVGDIVLVTGNNQTNNFWTLWKYAPYDFNSDSYGFVMIDCQKWRLQEGELWSLVDWYASDFSSNEYPQYVYNTKDDLDSNINNLDVTLLNGTIIKVLTQNSNDTRWSIYRYNSGKLIEVAREKSTIELSTQFYESDIDFGITNNTISNIPLRDGTFELKILLDSFYNTYMDNLQLNKIFFNMVNVSISLNYYNDWVFKTSFMYLGGCYEKLTQSPTVQPNIIDNVIEYINTVKPYHVTIRDYKSTYTVGPDLCNIHVTDFDFPTNNGKILKPFVDGELNYNNTGSNSDDQFTVNSSTYWSDWYNNYMNTNYDSSNYDENWNPIRKIKTSIKFDRVSCTPTGGWDGLPFDASIEIITPTSVDDIDIGKIRSEYKNYLDTTVSSYNELSNITTMIEGTMVNVSDINKNYIYHDNKWVSINMVGWDSNYAYNGAIDRISQYYNPTYDMIQKDDIENLISGCGIKDMNEIHGGQIDQSISLLFPWDYSSGYKNELGYYVGGINNNSIISTFPQSQPSGNNTPLQKDVRGRDFDIISPTLDDTNIQLPIDNNYVGPNLENTDYITSPEELIQVKPMDSISITVSDKDSNGNITKFRLFRDNFNRYDAIYYNDVGIKVVSDDLETITISSPTSDLELHDPNNPSENYLSIVKATMVDNTLTDEQKNEILGRLNPGIVWINGEKIVYWTIEKSGSNYVLKNLIRGFGVTSQKKGNSNFNYSDSYILSSPGDSVIDGSILSWLTYDPTMKYEVKSDGMYLGKIKFI